MHQSRGVRSCVDFIAANGPDLIVHDDKGQVSGVVPFPHTNRKPECEVLLLKYDQEFGLTPSSRWKLHAVPTEDGDELDDLLGPSMKLTG